LGFSQIKSVSSSNMVSKGGCKMRIWRVGTFSMGASLLFLGIFLLTASPVVAALCFDFAGLVVVFRYLQTENRWLLLSVIVFLYCAWAFKQTSVLVVFGICLWFLFNRRFFDLLLVSRKVSCWIELAVYWVRFDCRVIILSVFDR